MLLTEILVTAYAFVVGSCVGSFLNVVAWRLPLGMSLIKPASHCPQCKTPIRLRDNVPVLGWILLRGRCRSCGCWISPRYPLVEFAVGAAFALLAWFELATEGSNLPRRPDNWLPIAAGLPFDWIYLGIWIYHVTLVSILATIALVEFNGQRLTRGFYLFALCAALLPPLLLPELHVTFVTPRVNRIIWTTESTMQQTLQCLMFGIVLGFCLAWSFDPRRSERGRLIPMVAALGATGAFLGDLMLNRVAAIVAGTLIILRVFQITGWVWPDRVPRSMFACLAALATIAFWRLWHPTPALYSDRGYVLLGIFEACVLLAVMSAFRGRTFAAAEQITADEGQRNK